jgi:Family of unknown function (DUF6328)
MVEDESMSSLEPAFDSASPSWPNVTGRDTTIEPARAPRAQPFPQHRSPPNDQPDKSQGRNETEFERADRNLLELLQELRILALGVQVLFGFLLAIPFAVGFRRVDVGERHLYVLSVLLAVTAMTLLFAPVAFHRAVFRRHEKPELVSISNAVAIGGLVAVGLAVTSAVWLVMGVVSHGWPVPVITVAVALLFTMVWGCVPWSLRK